MSKITLKPVRLYTDNDLYDFNTDNRPLLDIIENTNRIVDNLDSLGFYIEAKADKEFEPVGGFGVDTCVCLYSNGLLHNIDITKSITEIDYSKLPIFLVIEHDVANGIYKCLSFSALYRVSSKFHSFLETSIGNSLKVGLGGQLVDSYYFDQYCYGKAYQDLIVGRIVSTKEIVFGGNQVSILGDNAFILKNYDDSTSGLVTVVRDNRESNVVFKSVNVDTVNSPYIFSEIQTTQKISDMNSQLPSPVYFTNSPIIYNQTTGQFLEPNLEEKLNEVHFQSPVISTSNSQDSIYSSAGVTVGSLLNFTAQYLLHNAAYSTATAETAQEISTSVKFIFTSDVPKIGFEFPSIPKNIGSSILPTSGMPNAILPTESDKMSGMFFGEYDRVGAFLGLVTDKSLGIQRPSLEDEQFLAETNKFNTVRLSELKDSSTLLIHAKSEEPDLKSNVMISSDGYTILHGAEGVHVLRSPKLDSEVVNKKYVDIKVAAISDLSIKKVSLTGTDAGDPITGCLEMDVSGNEESTSRVLKCTGLSFVDFAVNAPLRIVDFQGGSSSNLQSVLLKTNLALAPTDPGWENLEAVNKSYLKTYVSSILSGSASTNPYVTLAGTDIQTINAVKRLTKPLILDTPAGVPILEINTGNAVISSNAKVVSFVPKDSKSSVKLVTSATEATDNPLTLATKNYVDNNIKSVTDSFTPIWAIWKHKDRITNGISFCTPPDEAEPRFKNYVSSDATATGRVYTILKPCKLQIKLCGIFNSIDSSFALELLKNDAPVAVTGGGAGTTAAGIISGSWGVSLDAFVICNAGDILKLNYTSKRLKSSASVSTTLEASGYFLVVN